MIKQLSLFLENKPGRLAYVCKALAEEGISIRALCIADTTDFGVLRMIVDNPGLAEEKMKARNFLVSISDVIGVHVEDRPGGLASVLDLLEKEGISVEYVYAFNGKADKNAMIFMRLSDNQRGIELFKKQEVGFISPEEVYVN